MTTVKMQADGGLAHERRTMDGILTDAVLKLGVDMWVSIENGCFY